MQNVNPNIPTSAIWTDDFLWKKREYADPVADELVARIISEDKVEAFHKMYRILVRNSGVRYKLLPPAVRDYFEIGLSLPSFADPKMIKTGQEVFERHGPMMSMLLFYKSLPSAYACGRGVKVLHSTGRLGSQDNLEPFTRRLMETSQFLINVMSDDGLEPGAEGIITALKVRLIHASIRYYLKQGGWNTPHYGEPINQQDMAGTLMSFSALILEGLEQMQHIMTEEEKEAYIHAWRVVGHFMGLDHDLIPANAADANILGHKIFDQQLLTSREGIELTDALIEFSLKHMKGDLLREVPEAMIHFLVGEDVAKAVGVNPKPDHMERIVENMMGTVFSHQDTMQEHHNLIAKLGDHLKMRMLQGTVNHFNSHKQTQFYIPPSLKESWEV